MIIKLLEIRDVGTTIPAMAIELRGRSPKEDWLLRRSGYDVNDPDARPVVVLWSMVGDRMMTHDPFAWGSGRTMKEAHLWLQENWYEVTSGDVLDVQFILGETDKPKRSDEVRS